MPSIFGGPSRRLDASNRLDEGWLRDVFALSFVFGMSLALMNSLIIEGSRDVQN